MSRNRFTASLNHIPNDPSVEQHRIDQKINGHEEGCIPQSFRQSQSLTSSRPIGATIVRRLYDRRRFAPSFGVVAMSMLSAGSVRYSVAASRLPGDVGHHPAPRYDPDRLDRSASISASQSAKRALSSIDLNRGTDEAMPGRFQLAVVVINYKTPDLVIQCLTSLLSEIDRETARVVVVDNCSHDGSVKTIANWIATKHEKKIVRLVESETNIGFAGGNNLGIRSVDADYYLLLNSDTIVRPGAIAILLATAEDNRQAGMTSPRLEWPDETPQISCFRYISPVSELIDAAHTGPITGILKPFNVPLPLSDTIIKPGWTSFACVLLRREMLDKIGLMDDGFFLYFEDVEFCRRALKAGWEIVHNPKARVVHLRGGSSPVKKNTIARKRLPHYFYLSRNRYFYLAYGRLGMTLANILWSLGRCVSKGRELLARRGRGVPDKAWLDIWTNWLHPTYPWHDSRLR
jgi:N-acetylglucosaminyl-diphospho-decaprenol L-rhamnosyltransferase